MRRYANRKGWDLTDIKVEITFDTDAIETKFKIMRNIQLFGVLDADQKKRLLPINAQFTKFYLTYARENNLKIIPLCPFAKSVFDKTQEIQDLLF